MGLAEAKALSLHLSMLGDATFTDRAWRRKPGLGVRPPLLVLHSSSGAAFREELAYLPDLFPFLVSVVGLKVPSLVSLGALEARKRLLHREPVSAQRGQVARLRSGSSRDGTTAAG